MTNPADPDVDLVRFGEANHRHMTIREVRDGEGGIVVGWKLWCLHCKLLGERVYQSDRQAQHIAATLRSDAEPSCEHRTVWPIGDHP